VQQSVMIAYGAPVYSVNADSNSNILVNIASFEEIILLYFNTNC
jgi:hypothetical protein